ncbi:alpha/beta hydrolase [Aspergillus stella-maris]|uniref:alpha/beta hydrolase n=1 Tax=Aspergillus stella-maris TaxID=1810926 RepID=UPI003CCD3129
MPLSSDIQEFIKCFGSSWTSSVNRACELFFELCHASLPEVPSRPPIRHDKDVKYGPHERHRLDIFYSSVATANEPRALPVVVFFHGGGFKIGDNAITPHMHANIGRFLAVNGMVGVLGTYRLLPEARFPDGMEDIARALRWLREKARLYGGDPKSIFVLGHSAGGAHVAMALFSGLLRQGHNHVPRGIMFLSTAIAYDLTKEPRRSDMELYYNTRDHKKIEALSGLGMLRRLPCNVAESEERHQTNLPELFIALADYDFTECVRGNLNFVEELTLQRGRMPRFEVWHGHNHVSYVLSIGLPGDETGPMIVEWVGECLSGPERQ